MCAYGWCLEVCEVGVSASLPVRAFLRFHLPSARLGWPRHTARLNFCCAKPDGVIGPDCANQGDGQETFWHRSPNIGYEVGG